MGESYMEIMLDTANTKSIYSCQQFLNLTGVTTNPTILKKEGASNFFSHMKEIKKIIGQIPIHIQTIGRTEEEMIEDARVIIEELGKDTFIKVPVNQAGLQAIKKLKKEGYLITGTAIYTELQGYLAINNGVDYIAPYYNRMQNQGIDAMKVIDSLRTEIERTQSPTKILAASFKNCEQVTTAIRSGAHAITLGKELLDQVLEMPSIDKAVRGFQEDWVQTFQAETIGELKKVADYF